MEPLPIIASASDIEQRAACIADPAIREFEYLI